MSTTYTLRLDDPLATLETAGGKGASLARMRAAGLPVPGGSHTGDCAAGVVLLSNGHEP